MSPIVKLCGVLAVFALAVLAIPVNNEFEWVTKLKCRLFLNLCGFTVYKALMWTKCFLSNWSTKFVNLVFFPVAFELNSHNKKYSFPNFITLLFQFTKFQNFVSAKKCLFDRITQFRMSTMDLWTNISEMKISKETLQWIQQQQHHHQQHQQDLTQQPPKLQSQAQA